VERLGCGGPPRRRDSLFSPAAKPEELMAWRGTRKWVAKVLCQGGRHADGERHRHLFKELVTEEENHQAALSKLYAETSGADSRFWVSQKSIMAPTTPAYHGRWHPGERSPEVDARERSPGDPRTVHVIGVQFLRPLLLMTQKVESQAAKKAFQVLSKQEKTILIDDCLAE